VVADVCSFVSSVWVSEYANYTSVDNASDREAYSHMDNFLNPGPSDWLGPQNNCLSGARGQARGRASGF